VKRILSTEEQQRLDAHAADAAANPLTEQEQAQWLASLNSLDAASGKDEQLRVCQELLRHAPEDDMLDSDARIIKMAIEQLEEELKREPRTTQRVARRTGLYVRGVPDGVCGERDDEDADDSERATDPFLGYDESDEGSGS
jgi:hypothetical protein